MADTVTAIHSPIGASSMYRGVNCPGSVALSRLVTNYTSTYAEEGSFGHDLAKKMLEAELEGKPGPDTDEYEPDLIDLVETYVQHAVSLRKPGCTQFIERRLSLETVAKGAFGTLDLGTYYPAEYLMIITDLKLGGGVLVSPKRNLQLMFYALALMIHLAKPVRKIRLEIFQPRNWTGEPLSTWETDIFDLLDFQNEVIDFAAKAADPNALLKPGAWCQFCPAVAVCPVLQKQTKGLIGKDALPVNFYTPEEIGDLLHRFPEIENFIRRVREFAYQEAMARRPIPGWKLTKKQARSKWKKEAPDVMFFKGVPALAYKPRQLLGITEFKKKFPSYSKLAEALIDKGSSGHTLVPADSDREEARIGIDFQSAFGSADEIDPLS